MKIFSRITNNQTTYLDYMASTPVDNKVWQAMSQYYHSYHGNPYSAHSHGVEVMNQYNQAIDTISEILRCPSNSLYPTSGATESNAIAVQGVIKKAIKNGIKKPHIIVSAIEHPSVLGVKQLEAEGVIDVDYLPVNSEGVVQSEELANLLRAETVLVSVMLVNSEIGTIQPIDELAKITKKYKKESSGRVRYPLLHSDASQAMLSLPINLQKLHVDLMTLNGHKLYAPTGIGLLYVSPTVESLVESLFVANYDDSYLRPGTAPVGLVVGLATAMCLIEARRHDFVDQATQLFGQLSDSAIKDLGAVINGSVELGNERVPHNISLTFRGVNHEFLQMQLDAAGISVATRSACLERGGEGSRVLSKISPDEAEIKSAIRISFGYETTATDINRLVAQLKLALEIQRNKP